jgi:glycerol-3-phosphate dehydrogenase
MSTSQLNPVTRREALERIQTNDYDVLVIGGGVTGAGTALDAATRGLRVALVEKRDWASGTSSRSGKLFHGGLRYLEQLNFALVREALKERGLMLKRLCPHLVKPIKFGNAPTWGRVCCCTTPSAARAPSHGIGT